MRKKERKKEENQQECSFEVVKLFAKRTFLFEEMITADHCSTLL